MLCTSEMKQRPHGEWLHQPGCLCQNDQPVPGTPVLLLNQSRAYKIIDVVALARGITVWKRIMCDIVDLVLVQKRLIDDPGCVCHNLINPSAQEVVAGFCGFSGFFKSQSMADTKF